MKIAYLVMAFDNFEHLKKLIKALDDKDVVFYIHLDKKMEVPTNIFSLAAKEKIIFVKRMAVWWGGWSQVETILGLMKEAVKDKFDYYALISGVDYPIRANSFFFDKLKEGVEYMNIIKGFQSHKPLSRVRNFYFDGFDRRNESSLKTKFFLVFEKVLLELKIVKRRFPFKEVFHGSTWWVLSHNCVEYILKFTGNNPRWVRFYKTSLCPDEGYIPTVIGNSVFLNRCQGNLTYTDWSTYPAPAIITKEHMEQFKRQTEFEGSYGKYTPFFARKFNDQSVVVVEQIEKELRN